ncbi:Broad complex [Penaeus vannamei]|uniref:Broad complex n=1 Tax=Penaeus vannamei TaxID=6689 RepID=A0A3R7SJL9_PENVA|nr:Broad complex [Penaeus vannamei]
MLIFIFSLFSRRINTMTDELLSLKWNNHKSTFADILTILRDQEVFIDVTLACGGKQYPAHKFVLSTCSDYFKEMFTKNPCKHPIVFMKDVSARDLEALLDFMYRGEVNVPHHNLASLIKTAEGLQVKGLAVPDDPIQLRRADRSSREVPTPRPPPEPSVSPPPNRKRMRDSDYMSVGPLGLMYKMSPQEPNSPYDLSQKSSSSSVSQSDNVQSECTQSVSPDQAHNVANKENSPDDNKQVSSTPQPPRTPQPTCSPMPLSSSEVNCQEKPREESDPMPGPSWRPGSAKPEEELVVKEDISIEEEEEDWGLESGAGSEVGDVGEHSQSDLLPPHSCTNSSLASSIDPALGRPPPHALSEQLLGHGLKCPICQKEFKVLGSLKRHYRSHINFKPYICDICGKRFTLNQYLIEHRRTHTGERPYTCHVCGKSFAQTGTLYHHVRNVHQKDLSAKSSKSMKQEESGMMSPQGHSGLPQHHPPGPLSGSMLLPPGSLWPQDTKYHDIRGSCSPCPSDSTSVKLPQQTPGPCQRGGNSTSSSPPHLSPDFSNGVAVLHPG